MKVEHSSKEANVTVRASIWDLKYTGKPRDGLEIAFLEKDDMPIASISMTHAEALSFATRILEHLNNKNWLDK